MIFTENIDKTVLDYEQGLKRFAGNTDLYKKYLYKFLQDESFTNMNHAIKNNDIDTAFLYAHTLKGIAGNLSLTQLYDNLVHLVEALRIKETSYLTELVDVVKESYCLTISVIKQTNVA